MPNILMRTACGCEKLRAWPSPLPSEIRVVLKRPATSFASSDEQDLAFDPMPARRFVWRGHEMAVPPYVEYDEVAVKRPGAPRLTNEEWAAAIARFQRENTLAEHGPEDRERAASWATADLAFLARHDGGVVVYHNGGALIGAFYPAPSWDASEDCVRFWSALRSLLAQEPR